MEITIHQEKFILDPSRAIYHTNTSSLIIADLHFGKTTHFRKHGIAIPSEIAENDLKRLSQLILDYQPENIWIAGDFFHASLNSEIELFKNWRQRYAQINFILVQGNHDRLKATVYEDLNIQLIKNRLEINAFHITHHPIQQPEKLTICGHIHPGVKLKLKGKQYVRLPSFVLLDNLIILPAFSEFTGIDTSYQHSGRNFVIVNNQVIEV